MSTVVIGTAGHIDHGKTTLLRALTGIDADRLPEERARGLTIDVGYAHLDLADGSSLDFVDVPGHDKLVGNMLVGAGEIDAAMIVIAADDGPRAQTHEHLELLDALDIRTGIAVITKIDLVDDERLASVRSAAAKLLEPTTLAGVPVLAVSAGAGLGLDVLRAELLALRDRVAARALTRPAGPLRLGVDRAFAIKGRGSVVTGTLRGGSIAAGESLRLEPGGAGVRVREVQVHGQARRAAEGGRTALNLAGVDLADLRRGQVLTSGPGVESTDRLLVALRPRVALAPQERPRPGSRSGTVAAGARGPGRERGRERGREPRWPPADGSRLTLHLGTAQVEAVVSRRGRDASDLPDGSVTAVLRLAEPVATMVGDLGVLRRPSPGDTIASARVLDTLPARGVSRRRSSPERLAALASAIAEGDANAVADASIAIHGALPAARLAAVAAALRAPGATLRAPRQTDELVLAPDVIASLERQAIELVAAHHQADPMSPGLPLVGLGSALQVALRRGVSVDRSQATAAAGALMGVVDDLVARGRLARAGGRVTDPGRAATVPGALSEAMDRLEVALAVPAPPSLSEAARTAGCPLAGIQSLVAAGRIVRVEDDLAWSATEYGRLTGLAMNLAEREPLTPAVFRDATGSSRRYVLAILDDLGRRGLLRRTEAGHVLGPRAPRSQAQSVAGGPRAS